MNKPPSIDQWLEEAKKEEDAKRCGMYLAHNGTVRQTAKAQVRQGARETEEVIGMYFDYDKAKADLAIEETLKMPGIYHVRVWMAQGKLGLGDDIMRVLIGGDIRPHVIDGLQFLVGRLKNECVIEKEIFN